MSNSSQNTNQNISFIDNLKEKLKKKLQSKTAKILTWVFFIVFSSLCFYVAFQNGVEKSNVNRANSEFADEKMKTVVDDNF